MSCEWYVPNLITGIIHYSCDCFHTYAILETIQLNVFSNKCLHVHNVEIGHDGKMEEPAFVVLQAKLLNISGFYNS